jgi:membrane protein implicated in regulation of membrane protease activity
LPALLLELVRVEVEQIKREMARKLKNLGVGAILVVMALSLTTFFFGTLIAAAVFGFAELMPTWAAALLVAGIILAVIVILLAIAVARFKKGSPPLPTESFDSIVEDANAIKGEKTYDQR